MSFQRIHIAFSTDLAGEKPRYFLDPEAVYGDDLPGETFRVLKAKEIEQYGEYRTRISTLS